MNILKNKLGILIFYSYLCIINYLKTKTIKNMKKLLAFAVITLVIASCGSASNETATDSTAVAVDTAAVATDSSAVKVDSAEVK